MFSLTQVAHKTCPPPIFLWHRSPEKFHLLCTYQPLSLPVLSRLSLFGKLMMVMNNEIMNSKDEIKLKMEKIDIEMTWMKNNGL